MDARRALWAGIVAGFLVLALAGPVVMAANRFGGRSTGDRAPVPAAATDAAGDPTVRMAGLAFAPATLTVRRGTTVTFTNDDVVPHTVTATDDGGTDSGTIAPGRAFRLVVDRPLDYTCSIHPDMRARVALSG